MSTSVNSSPKVKILVIIPHYLPGTKSGGPVRTISNLVQWLGDDFEFRILTSDRDIGDSNPYPNIVHGTWYHCGKAIVRYLTPSEHRFFTLRNIINNIEHDLVYLNGIFPPLAISVLLLHWFRLCEKRPVIVAPRGQIEPGALSIKPIKKRIFLIVTRLAGLFRNVVWHVASENEREDVIQEFGRKHSTSICVVSNLSTPNLDTAIREPIDKIPGELRLIFLSRISRKKNLDFALRSLKDLQGMVTFDIYGPIEDQVYWKQCQAILTDLSSTINVIYKGIIPVDQTTLLLSNYHLLILPTRGENFGHVILEALCAGCPVLISDRTPWNDINAHGVGWALPLEDPNRFRAVIQQMVNVDGKTWRTYSERARAYGASYVVKSTAVEDMRRFLKELALGSN